MRQLSMKASTSSCLRRITRPKRYATSVVTSATYAAARRVATVGHHASQADVGKSEAAALDALGGYAQGVRFEWDVATDTAVVRLHVTAKTPLFLGPSIDALVGFDQIDRTVVV